MTSKKHRMIIYGVAAQLLLIAIVCYAAFPVEEPEEPIRLMYQTKAGKVLFDHQTHAGDTGYGLACVDCHHPHPPDEEAENISCGECHFPKANAGEGDEPPPAYPTEGDRSCLECHDESEIDESEWLNKTDAIHKQCWNCHEEYEQGPTSSSEDCGKCHVL